MPDRERVSERAWAAIDAISPACQSGLVPRDPKAPQLRAVAPIVTLDGAPQLVAPVTLVANGARVVGVTSAELLRPLQGTPIGIATKLDGSATVQIATWTLGRYSGSALVELAAPIPEGHDVVPLAIGAVHATVDVHGAPAAIATIVAKATGFERLVVPVYVDADDAGGMSDHAVHLASPLDAVHSSLAIDGAPVFAWLPPDPALRRPRELVLFALAYPYRAQIAKPRSTPVLAELMGLEDLGRALISNPEHDNGPELRAVTGEIVAGFDDPLTDEN